MRKLWDRFVAWLLSIPSDKRMHLSFGMLIAAFVVIALHQPWWALVSAMIAGCCKEIFDWITTKSVEVSDYVWTSLGGLIIQLFVVVGWLIQRLWFTPAGIIPA